MEIFSKAAVMPDNMQRVSMREIFAALEHVATEHVDSLNLGRSYLETLNAAWVLTSERMVIASMPEPGQEVRISTWPGHTKFALFPRYFLMEDMNGNELLRAGSLWTIMNLQTRKIVYPGDTGLTVEGIVTGKETPLAKTIPSVKEEPEILRTVLPENIDANGHMNNTVYLDWFEDILPDGFFARSRIEGLTIIYKKELLLGDQAQIRINRAENRITAQAISGGTTAFSVSADIADI